MFSAILDSQQSNADNYYPFGGADSYCFRWRIQGNILIIFDDPTERLNVNSNTVRSNISIMELVYSWESQG